jgi:hypothetical protein
MLFIYNDIAAITNVFRNSSDIEGGNQESDTSNPNLAGSNLTIVF